MIEQIQKDQMTAKRLAEALKNKFERKYPRILCVGTDRWTGDALGPIVGEALANKGLRVEGSLKKPLRQEEIAEIMEKYKADDEKILLIDSALGVESEINSIILSEGKLVLGRAVNKGIEVKPDLSIRAIVNRTGFLNQEILQNTRLYHVMELSKPIIQGIELYFEGAKILM